MIATPSYNYLSPVEYLQGEETSPIKHEYRDGEVYAMAVYSLLLPLASCLLPSAMTTIFNYQLSIVYHTFYKIQHLYHETLNRTLDKQFPPDLQFLPIV
jgi:hypothetical protein